MKINALNVKIGLSIFLSLIFNFCYGASIPCRLGEICIIPAGDPEYNFLQYSFLKKVGDEFICELQATGFKEISVLITPGKDDYFSPIGLGANRNQSKKANFKVNYDSDYQASFLIAQYNYPWGGQGTIKCYIKIT